LKDKQMMTLNTTRYVPCIRVSGYAPSEDPYKCPELRQTSHRPGAYDAFTHPSLIANVRVAYKGAKK
jgi:hypothetical protein